LTAPLQSYGDEATFKRRTTWVYPSKSAVIGMIGSALGYSRKDPKISGLNDLSYAVRVDQAGRILTDYHTVELDKGDLDVTYRDYIQDAVFVVAVGSKDDQQITKIHDALRHPHYQLFLGRRANVPAGVLLMEEFEDENPVTVLEDLDWQVSPWSQKVYQQQNPKKPFPKVSIYADANLLTDHHSIMVKDRVGSFDQRNRYFGYREMATERIQLKHAQVPVDESTEHDALSAL
jgi:CRISPR-associated protein Cas5/CasD, subtype I-E/ECOLI